MGSDLSRILWYFHVRADDPSGEVAGYSVAYVCAKRFVGCGSEPRAARAFVSYRDYSDVICLKSMLRGLFMAGIFINTVLITFCNVTIYFVVECVKPVSDNTMS